VQLVREGLRGPFVVTDDKAAADIVFTPRPVRDFYSLPRCGAAQASTQSRALGCKRAQRNLGSLVAQHRSSTACSPCRCLWEAAWHA